MVCPARVDSHKKVYVMFYLSPTFPSLSGDYPVANRDVLQWNACNTRHDLTYAARFAPSHCIGDDHNGTGIGQNDERFTNTPCPENAFGLQLLFAALQQLHEACLGFSIDCTCTVR